MRRLKFRLLLSVSGLLVGVLALLSTAPTLASWQDQEFSRGTFTAGSVSPPVNLHCTGGGLFTPITFVWSAPVGGVGWTSYTWTSTAPLLGSASAGTLTAGITSFTVSTTLLSLGTVQFKLRAAKGPWSSVEAVSQFNVTLGLIATC